MKMNLYHGLNLGDTEKFTRVNIIHYKKLQKKFI